MQMTSYSISLLKCESDRIALQEDLDKLTEWADMWLMEFNPKKCEHLTITNKHSSTIYSYFLGNVKSHTHKICWSHL